MTSLVSDVIGYVGIGVHTEDLGVGGDQGFEVDRVKIRVGGLGLRLVLNSG